MERRRRCLAARFVGSVSRRRAVGAKNPPAEARRKHLWAIFGKVRAALADGALLTENMLLARLTQRLSESRRSPYDFIVVDEAQDLSVAQLRLLAVLGRGHPDSLFFAGDLGQRIFQQPFSWKSLGVDIRGRSTTLRVNYRTSHQIRAHADRLLGASIADVDGNLEERSTVSVFNGAPPFVRVLDTVDEEVAAVGQWIKDRVDDGLPSHEIGVFVRSADEIERATRAVATSGLKSRVLDNAVATTEDVCSVATMQLAKGLEFRAVAVMACDDGVIPKPQRIESVTEDSDLEEVYNTERYLLYVACTRARDLLLVTGTNPASEFLEDFARTATPMQLRISPRTAGPEYAAKPRSR
jgi:superfamily I DNA/RNA helicase